MGSRIKTKKAITYLSFFTGCISAMALAIFLTLIMSMASRATTLSWTASPNPIVSWGTIMQPTGGDNRFGCREEQNIQRVNEGPLSRACVFNGSSVRFIADYMSYVSFGDERKFYTVYGVGAFNGITGPTLLPGTDTTYVRSSISYDKSYLAIYRNTTSRFTKRVGEPSYNWNYANPDFELRDGTGAYIPIWNAGHSENGKWIAVEALERGIILVNVETGQSTLISKYRGYYGLGANPSMQFRVSNDGRHVAIGGWNVEFRVIDVDNCGENATTSTNLTANTMPHPCPERALGSIVRDTTPIGVDKRWISEPKFNSDGTELSVLVGQPDIGLMHVATLTAPGVAQSQRLDYLALGDSYSSGEGDIEKRAGELKHYIRGTDVEGDYGNGMPEEKCHISNRSYPYKLMQDMSATRESAKSIACSGATLSDINIGSQYQGQLNGSGKPRLLGVSEVLTLQMNAYANFIPGRIEQSKFVEKYKPKTITITIGGNDIEFGKKLKSCIGNHLLQDCFLATEKGRAQLGMEIRGLYSKLKDAYKKVKADPNSPKLYVVGYPQFVSKQFNNCALNVSLSQSERTMINEAVTYLNKVIKAAANDSGAKYIDIEDSLNGHTLCDLGEDYVTGISGFGINTQEQEMFHPNAKGHNAIFEKIKQGLQGQTLKNLTNCNAIIVCPNGQQQGEPSIPSYFAEPMSLHDKLFAAYTMIKDGTQSTFENGVVAIKKGVNWIAEVAPTVVQPTMAMRFELNSDPVDLGTFMSNSDGSISASLNIPVTVTPGIHTLRMYGKTYSGEDVEYYQIIEVQGNDGDIDEDSIPDNQDACIYISAANIDADFDGMDDACDPSIANAQLYRARNGNTNNNEIAGYLYIERNTRAHTLTGVSGDHDPDGDGWALVGASQSLTEAGTIANFWIDNNKTPHVTIRTSENGCVQYAPADLSVISASTTTRTLNQEAVETTTCRAAPATDDTDGDGQPDSQQVLYRARNGLASQGEDPDKLYIERNTRAAEAQLGITDYATNDSSADDPNEDSRKVWSLLASSQNSSTKGVFNKLIMVNQNPVILAKDANNQCIALRPDSVSYVKQLTQSSRAIVATTIPQGESCDDQ